MSSDSAEDSVQSHLQASTPPGLSTGTHLTYVNSGGSGEWATFTQLKFYTNAFVIHNDKILLGWKKRGFGKHKYNGFGGKVESSETSLQAALRELQEEAGISAPLEHAGVLLFTDENVEWAFHIDIYRADGYSGQITESDEMRPEWFSALDRAVSGDLPKPTKDAESHFNPIPYNVMWETDRFWMPLLLQNRKFMGRADFARDTPRRWWFGIQQDL